jgi:hypothetical protein
VLRYGTIGLGAADRVVAEAAAFCVFSVISFATAVAALLRQE